MTEFFDKLRMVDPADALPGRDEPLPLPEKHEVLGTPLRPPFPDGMERAVFGMGPFYVPEQRFWELPGVHTTATGYTGGYTPNPTFDEVCSGGTGHAQAVLVVYDPEKVSYDELLAVFWRWHDPTQGPRQGNKVGTEYRSVIFFDGDEQRAAAEQAIAERRAGLAGDTQADITTELVPLEDFFYAEELHQQHLEKHPLEEAPPVGGPLQRVVRAVARRVASTLSDEAEQRIYDVYWVLVYLMRVARVVVPGRLLRRRDVVMVYDLKVSAMAFGEFATFCLLARLFQGFGLTTHIVLVDDEWREDFRDLGPAMSYKREQFDEMARALSVPGRHSYRSMGFDDFVAWRDGLGEIAYYPDKPSQDGRAMAYYWSWPMVETTLRLTGPLLRRRVILTRDTVARNLELELPAREYVVLAVRQGSLLPDNRDATPEEFERQLRLIRSHFPDHDIYVASDRAGTEVIRGWQVDVPGVRFARDFSDTFSTHLGLALGATAYVQVRGGGLSIPLAFSETPWFLAVPVGNEMNPWTRAVSKGNAWRTPWGSRSSAWWPLTAQVYERLDAFLGGVAAERER